MSILVIYGIFTFTNVLRIFFNTREMCRGYLWFMIQVSRVLLISLITYLLFFSEGKELLYGYWLITSIVFYVLHTLITLFVWLYYTFVFRAPAHSLDVEMISHKQKASVAQAPLL